MPLTHYRNKQTTQNFGINSSWNCHIGLQASAWKFPLPVTSLRNSSDSVLGSHKRVSGTDWWLIF